MNLSTTEITGKAYIFGDDIDTDQIYPGRYLYLTLPIEMARHAMEDADPNFYEKIKDDGGIIIAGKNFGCGSSREHAARVLLSAGIKAVIASSFARIFFRNAINVGLPIFQVSNFYKKITEREMLKINISQGIITTQKDNKDYKVENKMPGEIISLIQSGGLIPFLKKYGTNAFHIK
ncbi:MAG: 3-isopropylmalate dehydratase [Atribacterota bacterium]|nr:3-isopropylmalate dehydratase [Atribacterota bacterium]